MYFHVICGEARGEGATLIHGNTHTHGYEDGLGRVWWTRTPCYVTRKKYTVLIGGTRDGSRHNVCSWKFAQNLWCDVLNLGCVLFALIV